MSRCGLTKAVAGGIATCECISMVVLFGLTSRPGLACLRAAVAAYLFHWLIIYLLLVPSKSACSGRSFPRKRESRIRLAGFVILGPRFRGDERIGCMDPMSRSIKTHRDAATQWRRRA